MTLREVSERLGISFVRVKQIEAEVLNKLRKRGSSKGLRD
jgi:DNA-directed RNA polymerase sigma subunit (sigma70/sigma32)